MPGRVRRTSRVDVWLVMSFAGVAYLIWFLVIGIARSLVNILSHTAYSEEGSLRDYPTITTQFCDTFLHAAPAFDLVGVLWLLLSMGLIVGASRRRWGISRPWVCVICQTMAATLLAVWAGAAAHAAYANRVFWVPGPPPYPTTGWASLFVALAIALVMWVTALAWMIGERARLAHRSELHDGTRTHIPV